MNAKLAITALAAVGLLGSGAYADNIELTGTIRDFKITHPDFESYPNTSSTGLVESRLGEDGKPVLRSRYARNGRRAIHSESSFNQWFNDVEGVNIAIPYSITLTDDNGDGVYSFAREKPNYFFPIDDKGWGLSREQDGKEFIYYGGGSRANHNFHFTYELKTKFTYTDPAKRSQDMTFRFTGDDDVWVFINGRLAVDLGGVHSQETASVNLDEQAQQLGLEPGETYELVLFFAERCTTESNFRIETTLRLSQPGPLYD